MNLLVLAGLSNKSFGIKIFPLKKNDVIEKIYVVRKEKYKSSNKILSYYPPRIIKNCLIFRELFRLVTSIFLLFSKNIDCIYGIYLQNHCVYAFLLGKLFRKKILFDIIGTDIIGLRKSKLLKYFVKNSDIILIHGENSKKIVETIIILDCIVK